MPISNMGIKPIKPQLKNSSKEIPNLSFGIYRLVGAILPSRSGRKQ